MERSLLLLSFALGGAVWLCGFLSSGLGRGGTPAAPSTIPRFWLAAAFVLPIVVFAATLPVRPPLFASGHGLGTGFLLGGLLGLLAVWTTLRALRSAEIGQPISSAAAIAAPIGLALMASAIPSLWMRDSLLDALCGAAIGWLSAILLASSWLNSQPNTETRSAAATCLALGAGATVVACAMAALGELRGPIDLVGKATTIVHWDAPGLAFSSCLAVLLLFALMPAPLALRIPLVSLVTGWIERSRNTDESRAAARRTWRTGACAFVVLFIGRLVATRFAEDGDEPWKTKSALLKPLFSLIGPNPMFHVIALGVVASLLIVWLVRDHCHGVGTSTNPRTIAQTNVLAVLTLAAAGMIAFQMMGGFGLCLLLSVLVLYSALSCSDGLAGLHEQVHDTSAMVSADSSNSAASQIVRLVLLGAVLALYRLFSARFETELRGVGLTDHYALFGLLFGAVMPAFLSGYLQTHGAQGSDGDGARIHRLAVTGLLALVAPTVIVTVWGAKCALALLIGLAVSTIFDASLLSALLALAVALALTQWTHHILPLAQLTRDQKVNLLFWTTAVSVVALLLAEYGSRRRISTDRSDTAAPSKGAAR